MPFLTNLRATLLTGVLVILSVLGGCQKSAADHLALARSSIAAKDSTSAILHLKNALAQDAENAEARYLLGLQELAVGDAVAAVIDLKRARELKAEEEQVVPELAEAMVAAGQARFLIEQLGEVKLQNQAGVVRLATALAQAQLSVGNLPQAKVAIARALAADPLAQTALLTQARITLAEGDAAGALAQTMALITKAPRYADVWAYKGELHDLALGQQTQALAAYGKALEINPSHVPSLAGILSIQLTRKELDNSRATLAKLAKAAPRSFLAQYFEARLNHLEGKYVVARTQFQILQNAAPDNVAVLMAAGLNELALGSTIQAEALLSKAAALAPANPAARYLSAFVNLRIGRPEQATVALQPLLSSKDVAAEVLVLAAQARLLQGDPSGADNLFTQAEAMHSTEPSVRTALAVARASRGNGDAALRELESLAMSTDGIEADLKLISSRLARGELELAQAAIEALEKKQPDKPASFELRGQLMLKQGNPDGARKAFEMALQKDKHFLSAVTQLTNLDIAQSRFDQARARLKNFQVLDPGNAAVLVAMAGLEVRAGGSSTDVINLLTKATKANPRDVGAWKTLVTRHLISGNAPVAISTAQAAVAAVPDNVDLLDALARAQTLNGDTLQASGVYASIIRLAPQSPTGYLGLAALQSRSGDVVSATSTVKRLLAIDERSVGGQRLAAELALKRRQPKEAIAYATNLQRQYPDDSFGYGLEGDIEFGQSRWDAAVSAYRRGAQKRQPEPLMQGLHAALVNAGKRTEADKVATDWMKSHPKDTLFVGYLGDAALKTQSYALARKYYEQALAIDPNFFAAMNNLAWVLVKLKQPGAVALAQRAAAAAPDHPEILDTLALAYVSEERLPEAVEVLQRAISRAPNPSAVRLTLAKIYVEAKERDKAIAELERVLDSGKGSAYYAPAQQLLSSLRRP